MQDRTDLEGTADREHARETTTDDDRRPYVSPRLEHLGSWTALTRQPSVGIPSFPEFSDDEFWRRLNGW